MTTIRTFGLGLLVLSAGATSARAQAFQVPPRETFERLDANGDNVVERSEVPEKALPAFERLLKLGDSDKDGKLQAAEFRDLLLTMRPGGGAGAAAGNLGVFSGDPMARFKAMDKNGDGKVSRDEFPGRPAMFERVDANKDGFLEGPEVKALAESAAKAGAAPMPGAGQPGARIMAMDKNGDNKVSREEYLGAPAMFDRLDTDDDGFLSKTEAAEAPKVMLELLRAMDSNGDGKITRDEFRGPAERFTQLDADKDGVVTMAEIRTVAPGAQASTAARKVDAKKKD